MDHIPEVEAEVHASLEEIDRLRGAANVRAGLKRSVGAPPDYADLTPSSRCILILVILSVRARGGASLF